MKETFKWLISVRNIFDFDGRLPKHDIVYDPNGINGYDCFYQLDTHGKLYPTKHPEMVRRLVRTKGSVNLHIKLYKEGRQDGTLPAIDFAKIVKEYNLPKWFIKAVEGNRKRDKHYDHLMTKEQIELLSLLN